MKFMTIIKNGMIITVLVFVVMAGRVIWTKDTSYTHEVKSPQQIKIETQMETINQKDKQLATIEDKHKQEISSIKSALLAVEDENKISNAKKEKIIKVISKNLKGVFVGKSRYLYAISNGEGVNPLMVAAIMRLETANGTSELAQGTNKPYGCNNPGGLNWNEKCKYPKGGRSGWYQKLPSLDIGMHAMVMSLKDYYIDDGKTSIPEIGKKYAPPDDSRNGIGGMDNTTWADNVTELYDKMKKESGL